MIEWCEPYQNDPVVMVHCRMSKEDAIQVQKRHVMKVANFTYESDEQALEDFMLTHWATFVKEG